jgi:hypothetical protein
LLARSLKARENYDNLSIETLKIGYNWLMSEASQLVTAAELDQLTPNKRAELLRAHIVTDLSELPSAFKDVVINRAEELAKSDNFPFE